MACLGGILYDPATQAVENTIAAIVMTAMDTANLRITFTVPASGRVLVRQQGVVHGAATYPQIFLGVLQGAVIIMRQSPKATVAGTALATTMLSVEAVAVIDGLTPGASLAWDAAYGVKVGVASTAIKYGGGDTGFGGFSFEVWEA